MPDPTAIFAIFCIFGMPVLALVAITWLILTWSLRRKELEVRRLEAQARIHANALPDWIDNSDAEAITEWTLAQRELNRLTAQAAATSV
jgi:hypothetical protein